MDTVADADYEYQRRQDVVHDVDAVVGHDEDRDRRDHGEDHCAAG